jgi:hypothetical protein
MFKMELLTQHYYNANSVDFVTAEIYFSTSNGSSSQTGADSTPFYGCASMRCSPNIAYNFDRTSVAIRQLSQTSYAFYIYLFEFTGRSMIRVTTNQAGDVFTSNNVAESPTGCWINPDYNSRVTKDDVGLGSVDNTSDADKPLSTAATSALALKANLAGPTTFTGTTNCASLNASGTITAANVRSTGVMYTQFGTLASTSTFQTIYNFAGKRGLAFIIGIGTIASSIMAFFDNTYGAGHVSIVARNGNSSSSSNLGTAQLGTMLIGVQNSGNNLQVNSTTSGTVSWSVILL